MEFTVDITLQTRRPLTEETLFRVNAIGGVAVGDLGGNLLETTLTVDADNIGQAPTRAIEIVTERIDGTVIAVEAMTTEEADRRANVVRSGATQS